MLYRRAVAITLLAACGGGSSAPATTTATTTTPIARTGPSDAQITAQRDKVHHDELAAAHRKLEDEQQEALAATCEAPKAAKPKPKRGAVVLPVGAPSDHERCLPSCYTTEAVDPRAGQPTRGAVEIQHIVCQADDDAQPIVIDELDAHLAIRTLRRKPAPHKKGSWQAELETKLKDVFAAGSTVTVTGSWRTMTHPLTHEKLRCVAVSQLAKPLRHPLDACGTTGEMACEAAGNGAARAINVVHYRLAEAHALEAAGKTAECQQAALEAVAVARGLPRWRQYVKLNIAQWGARGRYRTRFDGTLDEETLFATVATLGAEAESVYASCGGTPGAPTTAEQEQSFHTCW